MAGMLVGLSACESSPTETVPPQSLQRAGGDAQIGPVAEALSEPLSVRVLTAGGEPVEGRDVHFSVVAGGGTVAPSVATTGADGRAQATWTLGTRASAAHRVRAVLDPSDPSSGVEFVATAVAGPATVLQKVAGDGQLGARGEDLPLLVVVRVADAYDNPVAGWPVTFGDPSGDGSFDPASAETDEGGAARARWVLADQTGDQAATVSGEGLEAVSFSATALEQPYIGHVVDAVFGGEITAVLTFDDPGFDEAAPPLEVTGQETVVAGGGAVLDVEAPADFTTLYLFVQGRGGHYELDLTSIEPAAVDESGAVLYELGATMGPLLDEPEYELRLAAGTGSGPGIRTPSLFEVHPVSVGPLQVSVAWNTASDLDLYVVEPGGEEISFQAPVSGSGGSLELDSNAGCLGDDLRNESITWPDAVPPTGTYTVRLHHWSSCEQERTRWLVVVRAEGELIRVIDGEFTGPGGPAGDEPGEVVTTFIY